MLAKLIKATNNVTGQNGNHCYQLQCQVTGKMLYVQRSNLVGSASRHKGMLFVLIQNTWYLYTPAMQVQRQYNARA